MGYLLVMDACFLVRRTELLNPVQMATVCNQLLAGPYSTTVVIVVQSIYGTVFALLQRIVGLKIAQLFSVIDWLETEPYRTVMSIFWLRMWKGVIWSKLQ